MKKQMFVLAVCIAALASCQKQEFTPAAKPVSIDVPQSTEKDAAKEKRWSYCETRNNGTLIANGMTCRGKGTECGRKDRCSTGLFPTQDPEEVVFEGMTRREFIELWNTDEGMELLMSKGVYVVNEE